MKRSIFMILATAFALGSFAQEDTQILVFRNTGEVNLFYTTELDSIFCSPFDTLGIEHETNVSQVFYTKDSAYVIPISEIDSVTFGSRNEIVYKPEVKILNAADTIWIIRVENDIVYFKSNTPATVLPQVGDKLFYPETNEMFPVGLAVSVVSVTPANNEIAVKVEVVDLSEIFDKFFYAGKIEDTTPAANGIRRAPARLQADMSLLGTINLPSHGSITSKGQLVIINHALIMRPLQHYYYADIELRPQVGFNINLSATSNDNKIEERRIFWRQPLGTVAVVFVPSVEFGLFVDAQAELAFNYSMQRNYSRRIIWKRQDGQNTITYPNSNQGAEKDHAQIDITLDGSLYFGLEMDFNFNTVGDVAGVQVATKIGPELSGQISAGVLRDLSANNYDATLYASGEISIAGRANMAAYLMGRENVIWGDVVRQMQFADANIRFGQHTWHLFPEFRSSRAVEEVRQNQPVNISTTTKNQTELIRPLETGFQVLDHAETPIQTEFVKTLKEETTESQGVATVIEVENNVSPNDTLLVRPVFKYAGYTIPYQAIGASNGPGVMPIITYMSKGTTTVIAGAPVVGTKTQGDTTLHIGNYLPVPSIDPFFVPVSPFITTGSITIADSESTQEMLVGRWKGTIDGEPTTLIFSENGQGERQQSETSTFSYQTDTPETGKIQLTFEDSSTRIFQIKSLSALYLKVYDEQTDTTIKFTKK